MMKVPFEMAEMEIINFAGKDIILTSDPYEDPTDPYEVPSYLDGEEQQ